MNIRELIEILEEMAEYGHNEVRIATQPRYPIRSKISNITDVDGIVYLAAEQDYDSPYAPRAAFEE